MNSKARHDSEWVLQEAGTMALVYASQLSDEPVTMHWLTDIGFRFTRNMHLLLCDELAIPLTGILTNPHWHLTGHDDINALNTLFRTGVVHPVTERRDADAVTVLNELLHHRDHLWIPTREQMHELADTIQRCGPHYVVVVPECFRCQMYDDVGELLARLNRDGVDQIIHRGSLDDLMEWHHAQRDEREAFRMSEFWSETIRRFGIGSASDLYLRAAGSASYHYGMARQLFSCEDLCAPSQYSQTIDMLRVANGETLRDIDGDRQVSSGFEIDLPLEAIAGFSLAEVVALRSEPEFKGLRELIRRVPVEHVEEASPKLKAALNACNTYLGECAHQRIRNTMLRHAVERRKSRHKNRVELVGGAAAGVSLLGFGSGSATVGIGGGLLAVFVFGCSIARYLQGRAVDAGGCTFSDSPNTTLNVRTLEQGSRQVDRTTP